MNLFVLTAGLLYLGSGFFEWHRDNHALAIMYWGYFVANLALTFVK